jgi:hypothetical protein
MKFALLLSILTFQSLAQAEPLTMKCICKCRLNWLPHINKVTAADLGLPATATRIDIATYSPRACQSSCFLSTGDARSSAGVCWDNLLEDLAGGIDEN